MQKYKTNPCVSAVNNYDTIDDYKENVRMNGLLLIIVLLTICSVVAGVMVGAMYKKKVSLAKIDTWFTGAQPYLLLSFLILFIVAVIWSTLYYSRIFFLTRFPIMEGKLFLYSMQPPCLPEQHFF